MRIVKTLVPAATLVILFFATTGVSLATPDYGKKEKKKCVTCHTKGAKPTKEVPALTATGKYYGEKKTLKGAPKK